MIFFLLICSLQQSEGTQHSHKITVFIINMIIIIIKILLHE